MWANGIFVSAHIAKGKKFVTKTNPATDATPIDLFSLDTSKHMSVASPCEILHPVTKAPTGQIIRIFGNDSEKVTAYINQEANSQLARDANMQRRNKEPLPPTVEKSTARLIELLIVATESWENVSFNGQTNVPFTVAAAKELYQVKFIREQLQEFMADIENFMKR